MSEDYKPNKLYKEYEYYRCEWSANIKHAPENHGRRGYRDPYC